MNVPDPAAVVAAGSLRHRRNQVKGRRSNDMKQGDPIRMQFCEAALVALLRTRRHSLSQQENAKYPEAGRRLRTHGVQVQFSGAQPQSLEIPFRNCRRAIRQDSNPNVSVLTSHSLLPEDPRAAAWPQS